MAEEADYGRSEKVWNAAHKEMATRPPTIGWMTGELANHLLGAFAGARTLIYMSKLEQGMSREEAERDVALQVPLLAFQLGIQVGEGLEQARGFDAMFDDPFGGDDEPGPAGV